MKKLFVVMCMVLVSAASFAQKTDKGDMSIGAHFNYMIDSPHNLGAGVNIGYMFMDHVRGVGEFNYFFKKDYASYWNVEANVEYLFHVGDSFTVYPLVGLDLLGQRYDDGSFSNTDTKLGLNLGVGVEYPIASMLSLKAEFNYKTEANGYSLLKAGIVIPF